jgi:hypothetical protein
MALPTASNIKSKINLPNVRLHSNLTLQDTIFLQLLANAKRTIFSDIGEMTIDHYPDYGRLEERIRKEAKYIVNLLTDHYKVQLPDIIKLEYEWGASIPYLSHFSKASQFVNIILSTSIDFFQVTLPSIFYKKGKNDASIRIENEAQIYRQLEVSHPEILATRLVFQHGDKLYLEPLSRVLIEIKGKVIEKKGIVIDEFLNLVTRKTKINGIVAQPNLAKQVSSEEYANNFIRNSVFHGQAYALALVSSQNFTGLSTETENLSKTLEDSLIGISHYFSISLPESLDSICTDYCKEFSNDSFTVDCVPKNASIDLTALVDKLCSIKELKLFKRDYSLIAEKNIIINLKKAINDNSTNEVVLYSIRLAIASSVQVFDFEKFGVLTPMTTNLAGIATNVEYALMESGIAKMLRGLKVVEIYKAFVAANRSLDKESLADVDNYFQSSNTGKSSLISKKYGLSMIEGVEQVKSYKHALLVALREINCYIKRKELNHAGIFNITNVTEDDVSRLRELVLQAQLSYKNVAMLTPDDPLITKLDNYISILSAKIDLPYSKKITIKETRDVITNTYGQLISFFANSSFTNKDMLDYTLGTYYVRRLELAYALNKYGTKEDKSNALILIDHLHIQQAYLNIERHWLKFKRQAEKSDFRTYLKGKIISSPQDGLSDMYRCFFEEEDLLNDYIRKASDASFESVTLQYSSGADTFVNYVPYELNKDISIDICRALAKNEVQALG